MRPVRSRSMFSLFLCVILGTHNKKNLSRNGAVHYCSRCGIVTRDDRRQGTRLTKTSWLAPGMKIVFGHPGQEYSGTVAAVNHQEGKVVLSRIQIVPRWRTWLRQAGSSIRTLFMRRMKP